MAITYLDENDQPKITYLDEGSQAPINPLGEMTPEQRKSVGLASPAQEALGTLNTATFGIPRAIANTVAGKEVIPQGGDVGRTLGMILPGAMGQSLAEGIPALAGKGVLKGAARGAIAGGVASQALAPKDNFLNVPERLSNLALGASTGGALEGLVPPILEGASKIPGMVKGVGTAVKNATVDELPFIQKVRQSFLDTKSQAGKDFGNTIDTLTQKYPDRKVDLSGMIGELQQDMQTEPKLASAVNKIPKLQEMLSQSGTGQYGVYGEPQSLTLAEAQDLKNAISSKLSQSKLSGSGVRPEDIPLFDAMHNVNQGILDAFPAEEVPELAQAKQNYGQVQNDYKMVKNKIKQGSLAGNIQNKFGGDPEVQEAVKRLIGNSDAFQEMLGYRRAKEIPEVAKKAVGGGLLFYVLHRLLGNAAEKLVSGRG